MTHISTLQLHQFRYGELDRAKSEQIRAHLDGCERCAARLRVQENEKATLQVLPIPAEIAALAAPAPKPRSWAAAFTPWLGLFAAAAIALFVALAGSPEAPGVRLKGETPGLEVWVASDVGPRPVKDGEALHPGDKIQVLFDPLGATEVWLAGRDGSGEVELYGRVIAKGPGLQAAPFALTLDATPGDQELFAIRSVRSLTEAEVNRAAHGDVPADVRIARVAVHKE